MQRPAPSTLLSLIDDAETGTTQSFLSLLIFITRHLKGRPSRTSRKTNARNLSFRKRFYSQCTVRVRPRTGTLRAQKIKVQSLENPELRNVLPFKPGEGHTVAIYLCMLRPLATNRAQELCESRGGRPRLPSLISLRFLWT